MFGAKFFQLKKKKARCIEATVSTANIKDAVIAMLSQFTVINDKDEVVDVDFSMSPETTGNIPVKIYIKKEVPKK